MKNIFFLVFFPISLFAQNFSASELNRAQQHAQNVEIIRDNYGIPHIYGKTDADAVFGLLYAQCEDDFKRVEMNYIEKLGRLAEVSGEKKIYDDLLVRLVIDSADAMTDYKNAPAWLHKLLDAFADGVNFYLYKHPNIKPALLHHFEPWYPLLWTDGSIGAISTAGFDEKDLKNLYGTEMGFQESGFGDKESRLVSQENKNRTLKSIFEEEKTTGSNGFAFAPSITQSKNAILYINPHVSFYFRPEVHVVSEEGLNAYGAVTWGQFFVYQGFNAHCGWMHTSSQVDVSDAYIEKITTVKNQKFYAYDGAQKPVITKNIVLRYSIGDNPTTHNSQLTTVKALYTQHGPIMAKKDGKLISVRSFNRSMTSLIQSWERTKATSYAEFRKMLFLKANTSNNTVYADAEGNIGYWHGNYVPIRDKNLNWNAPVDGTTKATEWRGLHMVDELVQCVNPKNGWLQNCNSSPFTVAGDNSPKKENYPNYMAPDGENFRGINAVRVLSKEEKNYTLDKAIAVGYDTYLAFFQKLIPALAKAHASLPKNDSLKQLLDAPIQTLTNWNLYADEASIATTLAVTWGKQLTTQFNTAARLSELGDQVERTEKFAATADAKTLTESFAAAVKDLNKNYVTWQKAWGDINRLQRFNNETELRFDDAKPSVAVGFTSSQWGQLCAYNSKTFNGTKNLYGFSGNSFICAVEFGKRIKAKSLLACGENGDVNSKHFADQLTMYAKGEFKDVLFYKEDVLNHIERRYKPGEN